MALPLENCVIERTMPRGYVWAKFVSCWTGAPESGRFFPQKENPATGDILPAAYFTTLVIYDRDSGWTEREIKLKGADAVWAMIELHEKKCIALVNAEGHVVTRSFQGYDNNDIVRSTVHIKEGCFVATALQESASGPSRLNTTSPGSMASETILEPNSSNLTEWPESGTEGSIIDDCPF